MGGCSIRSAKRRTLLFRIAPVAAVSAGIEIILAGKDRPGNAGQAQQKVPLHCRERAVGHDRASRSGKRPPQLRCRSASKAPHHRAALVIRRWISIVLAVLSQGRFEQRGKALSPAGQSRIGRQRDPAKCGTDAVEIDAHANADCAVAVRGRLWRRARPSGRCMLRSGRRHSQLPARMAGKNALRACSRGLPDASAPPLESRRAPQVRRQGKCLDIAGRARREVAWMRALLRRGRALARVTRRLQRQHRKCAQHHPVCVLVKRQRVPCSVGRKHSAAADGAARRLSRQLLGGIERCCRGPSALRLQGLQKPKLGHPDGSAAMSEGGQSDDGECRRKRLVKAAERPVLVGAGQDLRVSRSRRSIVSGASRSSAIARARAQSTR